MKKISFFGLSCVLALAFTVASVAGALHPATAEHDMYWKFQNLPMPPKLPDAASAKVTGPNIPYGADSVTVLVYRINFPGQTIGLTEVQMTAVHDSVVPGTLSGQQTVLKRSLFFTMKSGPLQKNIHRVIPATGVHIWISASRK